MWHGPSTPRKKKLKIAKNVSSHVSLRRLRRMTCVDTFLQMHYAVLLTEHDKNTCKCLIEYGVITERLSFSQECKQGIKNLARSAFLSLSINKHIDDESLTSLS